MSRRTGYSAWHLPRDFVRNLKIIGPVAAKSPGAGCFRLICGAHTTLTDRQVMLEKSGGRVHDEIWRIWFESCASRVKRLCGGSSGSGEERLFTAIGRSARNIGNDWPSAFRNAVNYHPGFAYTAVRRKQVLK